MHWFFSHQDNALPCMTGCAGSDGFECTTSNSSSFVVGERFSSYKQLKDKVEVYEKSLSIQLGYRDSRTLEAAKKWVPKRVEGANSDLKYYNINLTCMFSGKTFKSKCKGLRKNQQ